MVHGSRWLLVGTLVVGCAGLIVSCGGSQDDDGIDRADRVVIGEYDPKDGIHPRYIDLIVEPGADAAVLDQLEIQTVEELHTDDLGRSVITINATGMLAATLAQYGLVAEGHRTVLEGKLAEGSGELAQASVNPCGPWPIDACTFPWFDEAKGACNGGIKKELLAMDAPPLITVQNLGNTFEKRPVLAVAVTSSREAKALQPTVYVLGTHHAREWATTEVTLRLLRDFRACALSDGPSCFDPDIHKLLSKSRVVFVPVVNPDGYQFSRSPSGFRDQRRNRRPHADCSSAAYGVDINRNYEVGWGTPGCDSCSTSPCADNYIGSEAASEPETRAIQTLLRGDAFKSGKQAPVAMVSYHTFSDVLIYADGVNYDSAVGPKCDPQQNCLSPDFSATRRLFGDTENPLYVDDTFSPSIQYPSGPSAEVLYSVTGDATGFANFNGSDASTRSLAVTPELTSRQTNFYVECESNHEQIVKGLLEAQRKVIKRLLQNASGLVSTTASSAYATTQLGVLPPGMWSRELTNGRDSQTARPVWTKNRFLSEDQGSFEANVNGASVEMKSGRKGDQYHLYYRNVEDLTGDPLCLPCAIEATRKQESSGSADSTPSCEEKCVSLCDPKRLPATGWKLVEGNRGGAKDCWWEPSEPTTSDAILEIPAWSNPEYKGKKATHCHLFFSTEWSGSGSGGTGPVLLERQDPSGWKELERWPFGGGSHPVQEFRGAFRVRSEAFETNNDLPDSTRSFRFRLPAGSTVPKIKLFDPIVYCRFGNLP